MDSVLGMEEDDFGGDIGGRPRYKAKKVPNAIKQEHKRRAEDPPDLVIEEAFEGPEREFGDGSRLTFDLTREHLDLLGRIVEQKDDDCWARVLRMILNFNFNKDIEVVANRKPLSMEGLIKHILAGKEDVSNLAVPSLRRAIQFIKDVGLEKEFGRNQGSSIFQVKGKFRIEPNANSDSIRKLLQVNGPIGIYVHLEPEFCYLKNGIYTLKVPTEEVANYRRHVLILVACGETKEDQIFFLAQNTWGNKWGVNGYGRIIIEDTCQIVYLDSLL